MNVLVHALSPLILLGSTGYGPEPKPKGCPPIEKSVSSVSFTDVQVLVNGKDVTNGIVTVRKDEKRMSVTVMMKVDKKYGPVDCIDAKTSKHEGINWLTTTTSKFEKPAVMADGRLKATLNLQIPVRTGENLLRIRALGDENHDVPVYVGEGIIRVVEEE